MPEASDQWHGHLGRVFTGWKPVLQPFAALRRNGRLGRLLSYLCGLPFHLYCFAFAKQNGRGKTVLAQLMGLGTMTTKYI